MYVVHDRIIFLITSLWVCDLRRCWGAVREMSCRQRPWCWAQSGTVEMMVSRGDCL